ncbi:MAG: UDP-N-acetylglucosamine pyrophosphorylase [Syntrophales bacterium]|nr:UDP-N-acetylglucosamine pyrophosphorylase [Syntrophales bacterium]MCK9527119.1 UDP-N-acetylglucosamine pyrophosphorylase [Syntrophales bacterium]MDX9921756.1 UDP-N-acetylglucosamine pyrophosphorylase [Syntrophales bacterium]
MTMHIPEKTRLLMDRGVTVHNPSTVYVGDEVILERISGNGVVIWGGTRIRGPKTLISAGSRLGEEGPVTLVDCRLGQSVTLKGGGFRESLFLEGASVGSGAQVREACLLEEEAGAAHSVGLKQTILFPFVTLGSLVNFCDCLMAGGTGRKHHSDVGSSYVHFNFTPNQDKATASLVGDVPRGVMLRERPIFLGGQGGLVGPARVGYGTVVAAGTILREDLGDDCLYYGDSRRSAGSRPFYNGFYGNQERIIMNNINYIANLVALREWYRLVRRPFFDDSEFGPALYEGAMDILDMALNERIGRFGELAQKMDPSAGNAEPSSSGSGGTGTTPLRQPLNRVWPHLRDFFSSIESRRFDTKHSDALCRVLAQKEHEGHGTSRYLEAIRSLDNAMAARGTAWLKGITEQVATQARTLLYKA